MATAPIAGSAADRTAPTALALRHRAEGLSEAFPALLVAAERIAVSIIHGVHGRRRSGPGEDFWQYRLYSPGDAASRIDWRKSSRSDKILIRENEWAATNTLFLWASQAPGMAFKSNLAQVAKAERAALVALTLGVLAVKGGERVTAIGSPHAPDHTRRILLNLAHWLSDGDRRAGDLPRALALPRFSSCVLIGDFLAPIPETTALLTGFAAAGVRGHMVQVLDPAEESLPYEGRTEFLEFAGDRRLLIGRAETLRQAYIAKLAAHRDGLRDLARRLGWTFTLHHTDRPPQPLVLALHGHIAGERLANRRG